MRVRDRPERARFAARLTQCISGLTGRSSAVTGLRTHTIRRPLTRLTISTTSAITSSKWGFLLLANLLILFVGCFLETIAAITILVPILMPIVLKLGIDPVHFGLIMTLNLMIGLLHPPLGMVLFVLGRVAKLSVERTTMAILPWLVPLFLALIVITYLPQVTLWLPQHVGVGKH